MPGMKKTMGEFKRGALHSGSKGGPVVRSKAQAVAIGLSEARKAGKKVAPKPKTSNPRGRRYGKIEGLANAMSSRGF